MPRPPRILRKVKGKCLKDFPELLNQVNLVRSKLTRDKAALIKAGSHRKLYWKCPKFDCEKKHPHRWKAMVKNRTIRGQGCNVCARKKICPCTSIMKELDTLRNKRSIIWDEKANKEMGIKKEKTSPWSHKPVAWECLNVICPNRCPHKFMASPHTIMSGEGCNFCCIPLKRVCMCHSLATLRSELVQSAWDFEKNGERELYPTRISCGSKEPAFWMCKEPGCGHRYERRIKDQTKRENFFCPKCNSKDAMSLGERTVFEILKELRAAGVIHFLDDHVRLLGIVFVSQLTVDFYVEIHHEDGRVMRIVIEYDGGPHFRPVRWGNMSTSEATKMWHLYVLRDAAKNAKLKEQKIHLLRISDKIKFKDFKKVIVEFLEEVKKSDTEVHKFVDLASYVELQRVHRGLTSPGIS